MADTPQQHVEFNQVYVLRLWREAAGAPWRAALRPANGGERIGFADMQDLTLFLLRLTEGSAPRDSADLKTDIR